MSYTLAPKISSKGNQKSKYGDDAGDNTLMIKFPSSSFISIPLPSGSEEYSISITPNKKQDREIDQNIDQNIDQEDLECGEIREKYDHIAPQILPPLFRSPPRELPVKEIIIADYSRDYSKDKLGIKDVLVKLKTRKSEKNYKDYKDYKDYKNYKNRKQYDDSSSEDDDSTLYYKRGKKYYKK